MDKDSRKLKRELQKLSDAVLLMLDAIDLEMRMPSTHERGKRIAAIANEMDQFNDGIRYFTLGVDYRTDDKHKAVARLKKKFSKVKGK